MKRLVEGVPLRALLLLAAFALILVAAPYLISDYILSVLIIVLYFAYIGQAWNLMIGFAGLLSLGHALFVGIGTACLGAAGAILLLLIDVHPYLGPPFTLLAFIIVIVGGMGSLAGALLGGVLIGASEALAGVILDPSLKTAFSFALLIVVLLVRPQGLLGKEMQ